jgi:hypothetical protein
MSDKVLVRLYGGIGNQLFQYFAGLNLSFRKNATFQIDFRWLEHQNVDLNSTILKYRFAHNFGVTIFNVDNPLHYKMEKLKTAAVRKLPGLGQLTGINAPNNPFYTEFNFGKGNVDLRGYYQSYKYFQDISSLISPERIDWGLNDPSENYLSNITDPIFSNFFAIHIRGKDYLNNRNYETLDTNYYARTLENAIKYSKIPPTIIVFSDDNIYAKRIMDSINYKYYFAPSGLNAAETLSLMSNAQLLIAANSTFSYWCGLINPRLEMLVPQLWFSKYELPSDFYPINWRISN